MNKIKIEIRDQDKREYSIEICNVNESNMI